MCQATLPKPSRPDFFCALSSLPLHVKAILLSSCSKARQVRIPAIEPNPFVSFIIISDFDELFSACRNRQLFRQWTRNEILQN